MAATEYEADKEIERLIFDYGVDFDLYSDAQLTDLIASFFVKFADEDASWYLG